MAVVVAGAEHLVSAADAQDKTVLWGFLSRYIPGATPESHPLLDTLAGYAVAYYEDQIKPNKAFRAPDEKERAAMLDLRARLAAMPSGCQDAELIQNEVYSAGNDAGFDPLRSWFQALYEVLLGQSQGPRFGSFAAISVPGYTPGRPRCSPGSRRVHSTGTLKKTTCAQSAISCGSFSAAPSWGWPGGSSACSP